MNNLTSLIPDNVSKCDNVYDILKERGFIEQCTDENKVRELLKNEKVKFYIGFDPTADCLHVGHFMQIIIMSYMQKFGHTPVVVIGGGTGMVGDPSGRTDMRKVMDVETIDHNCAQFKKLFDRFIDFDDGWKYEGNGGVYQPGRENREPLPGRAISVNNGSWLRPLNFVEFVREVGSRFNVNTMLRSEAFKARMARAGGLTFFEFSYMLMQSYDFMVMARDFGVRLELGGDDQWSNIIGGVDLTRKLLGKEIYGMTFGLLTTAGGKKMGKSEKGALWLDPQRLSPYEFFQYWRNIDDASVGRNLSMMTFLPMEEVRRLSALQGAEINHAKEVLAYEVTRLVHGRDEADKALEASHSAFGGDRASENIPAVEMAASEFEGGGKGLVTLIKELGLASSNGEARRNIEQGGISLNGERVTDPRLYIGTGSFRDGSLLVQKGKKKFVKIVIR